MKNQLIIFLLLFNLEQIFIVARRPYNRNKFYLNHHHSKRHPRFLNELPSESPEKVHRFLCNEYEVRATALCNKNAKAEWAHLTDLDDKTKEEEALNVTFERAHFDKQVYLLYLKDLDIDDIEDANLVRQLKKMDNIENAALPPDSLERLAKNLDSMQKIYSTAKICPFTKPKCNLAKEGLSLTPDIENIMANSSDYDELLYTWVSWHDATGVKIKKFYEMYVVLSNQAAVANNFSDHGEMWRNEYEVRNLEGDVELLWHQVKPLYDELHTFVRNKLREVFIKEFGPEDDGLIPAHLLGNMWAQHWNNVRSLVMPYPTEPSVDIEAVFRQRNVTPSKMFDMANDFYVSLGMTSMKDSYDPAKGAIIEKIPDKSMVCHPSAWDFCDGADFRIKMCTQVNYEDFLAVHHELGHIQYFLQYRHQPILYRAGANPAFHEAIGDMVALSVNSPSHFMRIGLVGSMHVSYEQEINLLMDMALEKIAFLPYSLLLDKWRWDVLGEKIDPDNWNEHYWHYREKYQKVKPPIIRSNDDFDPGAKYHVAADTQYISYFIAHILQFQIHRGLCKCSGQYFEHEQNSYLHRCDLYASKSAGARLHNGLRLGASKHWTYVLKSIIGEESLSSLAILEYFKPLYKFLKAANEKHREYVDITL